jgi:hypothetical protein
LAPNKKIIRILTHTAVVDVTDDHSLLSLNGKEITPKECNIGTELLHKTIDFNNSLSEEFCIFTKEQAQVMGFFFNVGLQMDLMGETKKMELNDKINDLLLEYNIDLKLYKNER